MNRLTTPLARVRGLGSAKEGTGHWIIQRLTALALIPLCIWFLYSLLYVVMSADYAATRAWIAEPFTTLCLILLTTALFWHAKLGLQVVIEDYVHKEPYKMILLLINQFGMWVLAAMSIVAVLKIHLGS